MTWLKICGITNLDDALLAADLGVDALGFVLEPSSPRYVPPERLDEILPRLPRTSKAVAVFGQWYPTTLVDMFDMVQAFRPPIGFGGKMIEVRRPRADTSIEELSKKPELAEYLGLDTYSPTEAGGTGKPLDWELVGQVILAADVKVIVAGGLTAENVSRLIEGYRPFGVDVSSGVESEPGRKDHGKLRDFVRAVREV